MKKFSLFVFLGLVKIAASGQDFNNLHLAALPYGEKRISSIAALPGNKILSATSAGNNGKLILTPGASSDTIRTVVWSAGKMAEIRQLLSDDKGNVWVFGVFEGNFRIGGIQYPVADEARYTFLIRTNERLQMIYRDMMILRNFDGKFIVRVSGDSIVAAGEFTGETGVPGLPQVYSGDRDILLFKLGPDLQPSWNHVVTSQGETRITAMASGTGDAIMLAGTASADVSTDASRIGYAGNGSASAFLMMLPGNTCQANGRFIGLSTSGDSTGIGSLCHDADRWWLAAINTSQDCVWDTVKFKPSGSQGAVLIRFDAGSFTPGWQLGFSSPGYARINAVGTANNLIYVCGSFTDKLSAGKTYISGPQAGVAIPLRAFCCVVNRQGAPVNYCSSSGVNASLSALILADGKLFGGGQFRSSLTISKQNISSNSTEPVPWLMSAENKQTQILVVPGPVKKECPTDTTFLISRDSSEAIIYTTDCHGKLTGLWYFNLKNGGGAGVTDGVEDDGSEPGNDAGNPSPPENANPPNASDNGNQPAGSGTENKASGTGNGVPSSGDAKHGRTEPPERPADSVKHRRASRIMFTNRSWVTDSWPGYLPGKTDSIKKTTDTPPPPPTQCSLAGIYFDDENELAKYGFKNSCDTTKIPVLILMVCGTDTLIALQCLERVKPVQADNRKITEGKCKNLTVREAIICLSREVKGLVGRQQAKQDSLNARIKILWSHYSAGNAMIITDSVNQLLALGKKSQATADSLKRVYIGKMCEILKKSPLIMASESLDPKFASGNITIDSVRWTPSDGGPTLFLKIDISAMSKYVQTSEGKKCNILNQVSFHCAGSGGYESRKGRLVCNQFMMDAGLMTTVIPVLEEFEKSDKIVFSDPAFYIMNCDTIPVKPKIVHYKTPEVVMYSEAAWAGLKEFGSTTEEGMNIVFSIYLAWLLREKVDLAIGVADYSTFVLSKLSESFRLITGKSIESLTIFEDIRPLQSAINSAWDNYSVMKGTDKYKTKYRILLMKYLYDQAKLLNSIKKEY